MCHWAKSQANASSNDQNTLGIQSKKVTVGFMKFIDLQAQYTGIQDDVNRRIQRVLEHGQYINGPEIKELEARLAEFVGVNHAIGVSSGIDALTLSLMALGIQPGDEVIMPGFTYIATAETVAFLGAKPVFVDIEPATFNIDPKLIEAAITSKTKCIMVVSLYGQCADFDSINQIAKNHHLPVIEDGASELRCCLSWPTLVWANHSQRPSSFPSKPLVVTGMVELFSPMMKSLKFCVSPVKSHGEESRYHHVKVGMNGRLDTLQAAILNAKFEVFEAEIQKRQEVAARYLRGFGSVMESCCLTS